MIDELINEIQLLNPWLDDPTVPIFDADRHIPRMQLPTLLSECWDALCLILLGPRQAGKTTLGFCVGQALLDAGRFDALFYLNCDLQHVRRWLSQGISFVQEAFAHVGLKRPVFFIDEVQRIENPGLLIKAIVDLKMPLKLMVSGSSQLEIKSRLQEPLTGRQFEALVLPLSTEEHAMADDKLLYDAYPQVVVGASLEHRAPQDAVTDLQEKQWLLQKLYQDYIEKDIIEILKIGKPDVMQQLIALVAHASGSLVNYQNLARDCGIAISTVKHYLCVLEITYVIRAIKPFVGNKRQEIVSNPIYYFIDNGFRNQILNHFASLLQRIDAGFLIENFIFQELEKYRQNHFKHYGIFYWRTKGGTEVDFVLQHGPDKLLPIDVKYRSFDKPTVSRSFRSFLAAYAPKQV